MKMKHLISKLKKEKKLKLKLTQMKVIKNLRNHKENLAKKNQKNKIVKTTTKMMMMKKEENRNGF